MNRTTVAHAGIDRGINIESLPDGAGFFRQPETCTREPARHPARRDGLPELTPEHWQISDALRKHHDRFCAAWTA